ncbi:MAG TPA: GAF domain-containing SpoIIE family protein phosphatase [Thermoleophilaceae bacterium]|nr:GAF domain-containing SpoIIE family protein phosphatase [Thermoleophilaceae bacterium]
MTFDDGSPAAGTPADFGYEPLRRQPGDPLDLVLEHLRRLVRADAVVLTSVDRARKTIEPTASWFSSPELHDALAPALSRPYDRRRPGLTEAALERGRPLMLPRLEDWEAAGYPRDIVTSASTTHAWELIRRASAICCPIRTPLGRILGAITVLSIDPLHPLDKADLDVVTVIADLAALARERSELLATEAAKAREELLLKRAAEGTSATLEPYEVERQVVEHALQIAGADHGLLSRVQPGSQRVATVARKGSADVDAATLADVVRSRTTVSRGGDTPSAHAPIELGPRLFGVLSLVRDGGREFDHDDLMLVSKVARIAAAALANADAFQQERHLARTLTHGFVPESLPSVPGWDVGVLYEPADDQPTGGDLYGAWPLPDGDVAVVIGDVVGKGVETAALSAMARFFIEARSWDVDDPAVVLEQVNAMLCSRLPSDRFVTAFFGLLGERRLRYANAGHLAPLILRSNGTLSEAIDGGLPLGIDSAPGYGVHELELGTDDVLLGFTDGILEARREGRLLGADGLRQIVVDASGMTREPQALTELVHDEVRAWARGLSDDAAIVALRRRALA